MKFGFITTQPCVNVPPPADPRCADDAFAATHPDICPVATRLILKPGRALTCALKSIQFRAYLVSNGVETDVTVDSTFATSNPAIALIGASSGNCTGLSQGDVTVSATYAGYTAVSDLVVLGNVGESCCDSQTVAMLVMVDTSRSMSLAFSGSYATRLDFARAAATRFISEVNDAKDIVGLQSFNGASVVPISSPVADAAGVAALVPEIEQTQQMTAYYDALKAAIDELKLVSADLKVIVLISDGEDTSDAARNGYVGADSPITLLSDFKDSGGVVMCVGCRASGGGFALLSALATYGLITDSSS